MYYGHEKSARKVKGKLQFCLPTPGVDGRQTGLTAALKVIGEQRVRMA
jgi:hypothetical protein